MGPDTRFSYIPESYYSQSALHLCIYTFVVLHSVQSVRLHFFAVRWHISTKYSEQLYLRGLGVSSFLFFCRCPCFIHVQYDGLVLCRTDTSQKRSPSYSYTQSKYWKLKTCSSGSFRCNRKVWRCLFWPTVFLIEPSLCFLCWHPSYAFCTNTKTYLQWERLYTGMAYRERALSLEPSTTFKEERGIICRNVLFT